MRYLGQRVGASYHVDLSLIGSRPVGQTEPILTVKIGSRCICARWSLIGSSSIMTTLPSERGGQALPFVRTFRTRHLFAQRRAPATWAAAEMVILRAAAHAVRHVSASQPACAVVQPARASLLPGWVSRWAAGLSRIRNARAARRR